MVEDNPGDVRLAREALREASIPNNVLVAGDGVEALACLRSQGAYALTGRPDLILLDLNLPGKSGLEALAEIKSDQALKRIPVVVLTTSQAEDDIHRSYDLHANAYISKPVDLERFIELIKCIECFWLKLVNFPRR